MSLDVELPVVGPADGVLGGSSELASFSPLFSSPADIDVFSVVFPFANTGLWQP